MSKTELMVAAFEGREDDVRALLTDYSGMADANGQTALMFAASAGNVSCVQLLVAREQRMQVNTGETALMFAAYSNQVGAVSILLPYEQRMQDAGGQTALMSSVYKQSMECFRLLIDAEAKIQGNDGTTALMIASRLGWADIVAVACRYEARLADLNGMTSLMFSAQTGKVQCARLLLESEGGMINSMGRTALMLAAAAGHVDMVRLLIPVEVGLKDSNGCTALMFAAQSGRASVVELLIPHEAGQYNSEHKTALLLAIQHHHIASAILLLPDEGALRSKQGQYPLDVANSLGLTEVVAASMRCSTTNGTRGNTSMQGTFTFPRQRGNSGITTQDQITDSRMSIRELECPDSAKQHKNQEMDELRKFYEKTTSILPNTASVSSSYEAGHEASQLVSNPIEIQQTQDTPRRSSAPVAVPTADEGSQLHKAISNLSKQIHTLSQSIIEQERRVDDLACKVEQALDAPRDQPNERLVEQRAAANTEKLWHATRRLLEQNESQVTALGYNLHSVQKNVKKIAGEFANFRQSSSECIEALEQQCASMAMKMDEEAVVSRRSLSTLQSELKELKAQTPGRVSKNFSLLGGGNSDEDAPAFSSHTPRGHGYSYGYSSRGGTPRARSTAAHLSGSFSQQVQEREERRDREQRPGFVARLKRAMKYLFSKEDHDQ